MQTIVFNYQPSRLSRHDETMALKIAYLLASDVISAGTTCGEIYLRRILSHRSLNGKITLMANHYEKAGGAADAFKDVQRMLRQAAPAKHLTKDMIVARKMLEKLVLKYWDDMMTQLEKITRKYGYDALRDMTDKVIASLPIDANPELKDDVFTAVSELFRRMFPEETEPVKVENEGKQSIFFLPAEFLSSSYNHPPVIAPSSAEASHAAGTYLHHAFTFPYLHLLTAADLLLVRSQLQTTAAPFRSSVNAWANICYNSSDTSVGISLFLQNIVPQSAALQAAINSNKILSLCRQQNAHNPVYEVWIGEIPVCNLWAFYNDMETFTEATWQKLQNAKEEPDFKDRRWPVMTLKAIGNLPVDDTEAADAGEEIQRIRKYLIIE